MRSAIIWYMNVAYLNNIIIGEAVPLYVVLSDTYNENSENAIKDGNFLLYLSAEKNVFGPNNTCTCVNSDWAVKKDG